MTEGEKISEATQENQNPRVTSEFWRSDLTLVEGQQAIARYTLEAVEKLRLWRLRSGGKS